jgi:hypothetical protein
MRSMQNIVELLDIEPVGLEVSEDAASSGVRCFPAFTSPRR